MLRKFPLAPHASCIVYWGWLPSAKVNIFHYNKAVAKEIKMGSDCVSRLASPSCSPAPSEDINGTSKCPLSQTGYYRLPRFGRLIRPVLQDGVSHVPASPGAELSGRLVGGEWSQDRGLGAESTPEPGTPRQCCFYTFLCLKLWTCSAVIPGIVRTSFLQEGPQLPFPFPPPLCRKAPLLPSDPGEDTCSAETARSVLQDPK